MTITLAELNSIIASARESSPLANKALDDYFGYKKALKQDQDDILQHNKILSEKLDDHHALCAALRKRVIGDKELSLKFTRILNSEKYIPGVNISYAIKTNKLTELTQGTESTRDIYKILDHETSIARICAGKPPTENYNNEHGVDEPQEMGWDNGAIYGNSRSSLATVAYLQTNLALQGEVANRDKANLALKGKAVNCGTANITLQRNSALRMQQGYPWVDDAAVINVGALPKGLSWHDLENADPQFVHYSFRYQDKKYADAGLDGLAYVHSGYAFGGENETLMAGGRYPNGKLFGPHDCSSWTAAITHCVRYSTNHLFAVYRQQLNQNTHTLTADMSQSKVCQAIDRAYTSVSLSNNPKALVKAGMLLGWRKFNKQQKQDNSLGTSGHIVMALGATTKGEVVTLGYNRDMPNIEGFGIQLFSLKEEPNTEKMLFSIKPSLT